MTRIIALLALALIVAAGVGPALAQTVKPENRAAVVEELRSLGIDERMIGKMRLVMDTKGGSVFIAISADHKVYGFQVCLKRPQNADQCRRQARQWCERFGGDDCALAVERETWLHPYRVVWKR